MLQDLHFEDTEFHPHLLMQLVQTTQLHPRQNLNNKNQIDTLPVHVSELIPLVLDSAQPPPLLKCHREMLGTWRLHLKMILDVCSSGFLLIVLFVMSSFEWILRYSEFVHQIDLPVL